jgi:hypothetical protein
LALALRFLFAAVLAMAALAKIVRPRATVRALASLGLGAGAPAVYVAAVTVELALAGGVALGSSPPEGSSSPSHWRSSQPCAGDTAAGRADASAPRRS